MLDKLLMKVEYLNKHNNLRMVLIYYYKLLNYLRIWNILKRNYLNQNT